LQAGDSAGSQASGNWQFIKSRQAGHTQALGGFMIEMCNISAPRTDRKGGTL
jgi:hypothetical protein